MLPLFGGSPFGTTPRAISAETASPARASPLQGEEPRAPASPPQLFSGQGQRWQGGPRKETGRSSLSMAATGEQGSGASALSQPRDGAFATEHATVRSETRAVTCSKHHGITFKQAAGERAPLTSHLAPRAKRSREGALEEQGEAPSQPSPFQPLHGTAGHSREMRLTARKVPKLKTNLGCNQTRGLSPQHEPSRPHIGQHKVECTSIASSFRGDTK